MIALADPAIEDRLDLVFQALANRTRRAILRRVSNGPARITELAAPFEMALPSISKHVAILERAGLINRSVQGRVHSCAFDPGPLASADEWLSAYRTFWTDNLDGLARFVEGEPEIKKGR
jgi:DNA-binding transcriptional ArsR family regulator